MKTNTVTGICINNTSLPIFISTRTKEVSKISLSSGYFDTSVSSATSIAVKKYGIANVVTYKDDDYLYVRAFVNPMIFIIRKLIGKLRCYFSYHPRATALRKVYPSVITIVILFILIGCVYGCR